ncbi:hypothetical protein HYR99_14405 [Candidatus Poribacteria bacterium]|nr:hypothetical protein [Candidatus Poribacteria bacterium]
MTLRRSPGIKLAISGDGYDDNVVSWIEKTSDGLLWLGTRAGVFLYDGVAWAQLDTRDGLVGNNVRAMYREDDSTFWFATNGGVTRYTQRIRTPGVRIRSVQTDRVHTDLSALPPMIAGEPLTIAYSAIDFATVPQKRQYRIRIDDEWHPPTKANECDLRFETPGTYPFSVQAIDRDLNYSEPATVTLTVIPDPRDLQIAELETELQRRNRELEAELMDAHDVQMSLMPVVAPHVQGVEIAGTCLPATTVSGDFFDYLIPPHPSPLPQGERETSDIALVVGDVTGHGMKGAMNAMMTDGCCGWPPRRTRLSPLLRYWGN